MKLKFLILPFFLYPAVLISQEKLNSLKVHTSPASYLLGLQPTSVLSPKNYEALETAIFSNLGNDNKTDFLKDFALEFMPYWTQNHSLPLDEYLYPKNALYQLIRNSSFSLASTQNFLLGDSTTTNGIALGYRTTFYLGHKADRERIKNYKVKSRKADRIFNAIGIKAERLLEDSSVNSRADFLGEVKDTIIAAFRMYESEIEAVRIANKILRDCDTLKEMDPKIPENFVDRFYVVVDRNLKSEELFNQIKGEVKERYGLSLDVAYASLLNFPRNEFEYSFVTKQSVWVTPTYRFKSKLNFLKLMLVFRYEWYNLDYYKKYFSNYTIYKSNNDYGFAISTEFDKFSLQFELVKRHCNTEVPAGINSHLTDSKADTQYIGTFSYNLTNQIVLSYSLGNRFDPVMNPNNTLVSNLSINIGFGTPTKNVLK